jgi:hypothetical protein
MNWRAWLAGVAVLASSASAVPQDKEQPKDEAVKAEASPEAIDAAIHGGLAWLCRHQDADGAWRAQSVATHCDEGTPCVSGEFMPLYDTGLTALAVLALLGTGTSADKPVVVHGAKADVTFDTWECTKRAVAWLISKQDKAGSVSEQTMMYSDCLAAIALCEAYRVNKDWAWRQAAQRTVEFIEEGQHVKPQAGKPNAKALWGWRYLPKEGQSDTSVTGWAVRAFDSADRAGIHVPKAAMTGALDYIEWVTGPSDGLVGYMESEQGGMKVTGHNDHFDYHAGTMSAIAITVRLRADKKPDKAAAEWMKSAVDKVLLKDLPTATPLAVDYYYWHHAAEAWSLLGSRGFGKLAETGRAWRTALLDALLSLQSAPGEKCSSGGWLTADRWAWAGGPTYTTAINVLTLQGVKPR